LEEFLDKLREDQRRMRKFLLAQGVRFKRMGEALAVVRERGGRIFVAAEDPLSGLARVIAEEYLVQLPALPLDIASTAPIPEEGSSEDDLKEVPEGQGPPTRSRRLARHFRAGDVLLIFAHKGDDPTTKALLGYAKMRGVHAILIGGLEAKATLRRAADDALILPTRGVKTVCEGSFICSRILARCARAVLKAKTGEDETRMIRVECTACKEAVFVEERYRGKKGQCPLCRAAIRVPEAGPEVEVAQADTAAGAEKSRRASTPEKGTKKILKPSVMDFEAPEILDGEYLEAQEPPPPPPLAKLPSAPSSSRMGTIIEPDEPPPVGLDAESARLDRQEPSGVQIAPEDVAFDEFAATQQNLTDSADPFGLPNGFVQDLVMPRQPGSDQAKISTADLVLQSEQLGTESPHATSGRLVSGRFTVSDCHLRFGRGGFPDGDSPTHALEALSPATLSFRLNQDDEMAGTLEKGDELYVRLEVPAFLEPVLVRGAVLRIGGSSGGGPRGSRVELELRDVDPLTARKLARAAESLVTA
jgi:hypothetical protein